MKCLPGCYHPFKLITYLATKTNNVAPKNIQSSNPFGESSSLNNKENLQTKEASLDKSSIDCAQSSPGSFTTLF